ncbi:MAG: biotin/lipoyl-binding protein, partial [Mariniphaga sp.]
MARKSYFRISVTIVLILVLAGIIFYPKLLPYFQTGGSSGSAIGPRGMGGGQQPLFASGYVVVPTQMNELIYSTGTLLPDEEVDLAFETSGKIVGIYFDEGTRVKQGDLLAKINDKPLQAQLLKLQAQKKLVEEREFRQRQLLDRDAISRES